MPGDALTQQPSVSDWSEMMANEDRQHDGYYTDTMLSGRPRSRRGGWSRGGPRPPRLPNSSSYKDLSESLLVLVLRMLCTFTFLYG